MTGVVVRTVGGAFALVVAVPLLLVGATGNANGSAPPVVHRGGSDAQQVASAPEAVRPQLLAAAQKYALPPALLAAIKENETAATPDDTARQLLTAGRLPGGAWDAAQAVQRTGLAADVLTRAAELGYVYRSDTPPLDPDRYVFPVTGVVTYVPHHHDYPATDIFTVIGTPVVACVRAEVLHIRREDVGKGGLSVTLRGEDGWRYYYAHLSVVAAGLTPGKIVEARSVLGRSGNTGNARTTDPHLHFGISRTGYVAGEISPYPYLQTWPRPMR